MTDLPVRCDPTPDEIKARSIADDPTRSPAGSKEKPAGAAPAGSMIGKEVETLLGLPRRPRPRPSCGKRGGSE